MADHVHIAGHLGHDVAGAGAVVEGGVQILQVPVQAFADPHHRILRAIFEMIANEQRQARTGQRDQHQQAQVKRQQIKTPVRQHIVNQQPRDRRGDHAGRYEKHINKLSQKETAANRPDQIPEPFKRTIGIQICVFMLRCLVVLRSSFLQNITANLLTGPASPVAISAHATS